MDIEQRPVPTTLNPQDAETPAMATLAAPSAGKPLGALPKLPGMAGMPMPPPAAPPRRLVEAADEGAAVEARERVTKAKEKAKAASQMNALNAFQEKEEKAHQQAQAQGAGGASAAEVRARAEHLKKQRDLILAQRKKAREAAAAAAAPRDEPATAPPPQSRQAAMPMPPSSGLSRGAGYSSGAADDNTAQRAQLSQALAQNMRSTLLGGDQSSSELMRSMDQHKKADLDAAKDQLRREAADMARYGS